MAELGLLFYRFYASFMIILPSALFLYRLKRRPHFGPRLLACALVLVAYLILAPFHSGQGDSAWLYYGIFFLVLLSAKCCFASPWSGCLFCAVAGYSCQHIASQTFSVIRLMMDHYAPGSELPVWQSYLLQTVVYSAVFAVLYLLLGRQLKKNVVLEIENTNMLALVICALIIEITLADLVGTHYGQKPDYLYGMTGFITNAICSLLVLILQFELLIKRSLENELALLNQLLYKEREQFQLSKQTVDMINLKCHDMRHQIHSIASSAQVTPHALEEMERAIDIYDGMPKTGNSALDVLLAEKSLYCKKNQIVVSCVADGARLNFMSEYDVYSLFGNLLENAIHSVQELEPEKRIICLTIRAQGTLVSINSHNYCSGELSFADGLPVSTNQTDPQNHGFGVKSMKMIVEKYGGEIAFEVSGQIFNLNILLPCQNA